MRWRDQLALTLPTFILRLVLALTFLWAGTGKLVGHTTVTADGAARLANMGVTLVPAPIVADEPQPTPEPALPDEPPRELPDTQTPPTETETDTDTPALDTPSETESEPEATPETTPESDPEDDTNEAVLDTRSRADITRVTTQTAAPKVASDFPDPMSAPRVYTIALLLDKSADPALTADSRPREPLLPAFVGEGRTPVYLAWCAAITECLAGTLLLFGLLTRLGALSALFVMGVAIWTTTMGPAAMGHTDAYLGFIPAADDPWNPASYSTPLWQLAVAAMALAVFLLGPGPLSLDRLIFAPRTRDPYETAEPDERPRKKKSPPPPARDHFDRSPGPDPKPAAKPSAPKPDPNP
jgi:uncharacterized membrane protein YphA (DoxX/SURF4 family)